MQEMPHRGSTKMNDEFYEYLEENDFNSVAELIRTSARAYIRMEVKK